MFKNDDPENGERSNEKDSNIFSSDGKTFKSSTKVYNLEKHKNLLKIINMYMKDDKKNHSKMKIASLLKNKNNFKKSKEFKIFNCFERKITLIFKKILRMLIKLCYLLLINFFICDLIIQKIYIYLHYKNLSAKSEQIQQS